MSVGLLSVGELSVGDMSSGKCPSGYCMDTVKYTETNSETLKLKTKRFGTERSSFVLQAYYRCQHDTSFEKTSRESLNVLKQRPCKRFKNTYCPFQLIFKVRKVPS